MKHWIVLCVGLAMFAPASAWASSITFTFSGQVTYVASVDPTSPFPDPVEFDTPFTGNFTFDSAAPDLVAADAKTGSYTSAGGFYGVTLELGGLSFAFDSVNIGVLDDYPFSGDSYLVTYAESAAPGDPTGTLLRLTLEDVTANAFTNDALPLIPPPLAGFSYRDFLFTRTIDGNQVEVAGTINSLAAVQAVPEPSSLLLLGLPMASLLRKRLRFRR